MKWHDGEALRLGADVVQRLIPHRRPLLMVDAVEAFRPAGPTLWARRQISANEEIFAGHFPGLSLWPGIYTLEGLGQTSLLLATIVNLIAACEAQGGAAKDVLDALVGIDPAHARAVPAHRALLARLADPAPRVGMSGHVDLKFLAPVFAGATLGYRATLTHTLEAFAHFEVEAVVERTVVARGTMTGVLGPPLAAP